MAELREQIEREVHQAFDSTWTDKLQARIVDLILEERAKEAAAVANWLCSGPMERQFARDRARELRAMRSSK